MDAPLSAATTLPVVEWPATLSPVRFVQRQLQDDQGKSLSENFYWHAAPDHPDDLRSLETLPPMELHARVRRHDAAGKCLLDVTLENPSAQVALMAHLQLRRQSSGERILPVYCSQNYLSFVPHETRTLTIEAARADLKGDKPLIVLDGWNVTVAPSTSAEVDVALNQSAQVKN